MLGRQAIWRGKGKHPTGLPLGSSNPLAASRASERGWSGPLAVDRGHDARLRRQKHLNGRGWSRSRGAYSISANPQAVGIQPHDKCNQHGFALLIDEALGRERAGSRLHGSADEAEGTLVSDTSPVVMLRKLPASLSPAHGWDS